jgi:acetyl esterase/lipase
MLAEWARFLACRGYAMLAIDYVQSTDGASFPENLLNVQAALIWLHDQAASLHVDPSRIGLLGASSGAHLAALAALHPAAHPVDVLVLAYGIFDLQAHWQFEMQRPGRAVDTAPLTERMMGHAPAHGPEHYEAASPLCLASTGAGQSLKALILWGCNDEVVPPAQSIAFAKALADAGSDVITVPVSGAGHFWFSQESPFDQASHSSALAPLLLKFLDRTL